MFNILGDFYSPDKMDKIYLIAVFIINICIKKYEYKNRNWSTAISWSGSDCLNSERMRLYFARLRRNAQSFAVSAERNIVLK